jgi:5-hydroxyisourate hydrolase
MATISTHVLDTSNGIPGQNVGVQLEVLNDSGAWLPLWSGATDDDGRCREMQEAAATAVTGTYRLTFQTAEYFARRQQDCFYPDVKIAFRITDAGQHYHVPLLLNPFGYSTYRGS